MMATMVCIYLQGGALTTVGLCVGCPLGVGEGNGGGNGDGGADERDGRDGKEMGDGEERMGERAAEPVWVTVGSMMPHLMSH